VILDPPHESQLTFQIHVGEVARECVGEGERLHLDAVHQNHTASRISVHVLLAVRELGDLLPCTELFFERYSFFFKRIE